MSTLTFVLICLFLLPFQANAEDTGKAKIITGSRHGAQCISPVHILKIDGREVDVQPMGFELESGIHTMSGRTVIDTRFCSSVGAGISPKNTPPLRAGFSAGKTYWIGFDHNSPNRDDWRYVIWKVKD